MDDDLVPLAAAARRLGVTLRWLKSEAASGAIPSVCADGRYLVSMAAVERALLARAQGDVYVRFHRLFNEQCVAICADHPRWSDREVVRQALGKTAELLDFLDAGGLSNHTALPDTGSDAAGRDE